YATTSSPLRWNRCGATARYPAAERRVHTLSMYSVMPNASCKTITAPFGVPSGSESYSFISFPPLSTATVLAMCVLPVSALFQTEFSNVSPVRGTRVVPPGGRPNERHDPTHTRVQLRTSPSWTSFVCAARAGSGHGQPTNSDTRLSR